VVRRCHVIRAWRLVVRGAGNCVSVSDRARSDRLTSQPASRVTISLPDDLTAPAIARQFVHDNRDHLDPALIEDAQLLVTEIVTNAVRYGREEITLAFSLEPPGLGVEVSDTGEDMPVMPTEAIPPLGSGSGRGMHIINALATHWGVDAEAQPKGKVVWFELQP
jgi:anti-sigma regulatory factor (Ser/Thr protein kinase)